MISFSKLGEATYGRLGNQLFQIAATIAIAKRNNANFIFPNWKYSEYFKNSLPTGELKNFKIYNENPKASYEIKIDNQHNWDLRGFFQSENFFKEYEELIRYYLEPSTELSNYIFNKYFKLLDGGKTCSVHVRRGDYLNQSNYFPVQPLEYYTTAINKIGNDFKFIFFSDDIKWCKENFSGDNFYFIENELDIVDLFLMSYCDDHILSNSSFSWWGAWLNESEEKTVICPEHWFGPATAFFSDAYNKDIFCKNFDKLVLPKKNLVEKYYSFFNPAIFVYYKVSLSIINFLRPLARPIKKNLQIFKS